jgi:hypothetical protein
MPELAGVGTAELYSWQSGIALVRLMAAQLGGPPTEVAAWLDEQSALVTSEIGRRR